MCGVGLQRVVEDLLSTATDFSRWTPFSHTLPRPFPHVITEYRPYNTLIHKVVSRLRPFQCMSVGFLFIYLFVSSYDSQKKRKKKKKRDHKEICKAHFSSISCYSSMTPDLVNITHKRPQLVSARLSSLVSHCKTRFVWEEFKFVCIFF